MSSFVTAPEIYVSHKNSVWTSCSSISKALLLHISSLRQRITLRKLLKNITLGPLFTWLVMFYGNMHWCNRETMWVMRLNDTLQLIYPSKTSPFIRPINTFDDNKICPLHSSVNENKFSYNKHVWGMLSKEREDVYYTMMQLL